MKSIFQVFRRTAPALRISLRCPARPLGRGELLEGFPLRPGEPTRPARFVSDQPLAPNTGRTLRIDCYRFMSFQGTLSRFPPSGLWRLGASQPANRRGQALEYRPLARICVESQDPDLAAAREHLPKGRVRRAGAENCDHGVLMRRRNRVQPACADASVQATRSGKGRCTTSQATGDRRSNITSISVKFHKPDHEGRPRRRSRFGWSTGRVSWYFHLWGTFRLPAGWRVIAFQLSR